MKFLRYTRSLAYLSLALLFNGGNLVAQDKDFVTKVAPLEGYAERVKEFAPGLVLTRDEYSSTLYDANGRKAGESKTFTKSDEILRSNVPNAPYFGIVISTGEVNHRVTQKIVLVNQKLEKISEVWVPLHYFFAAHLKGDAFVFHNNSDSSFLIMNVRGEIKLKRTLSGKHAILADGTIGTLSGGGDQGEDSFFDLKIAKMGDLASQDRTTTLKVRSCSQIFAANIKNQFLLDCINGKGERVLLAYDTESRQVSSTRLDIFRGQYIILSELPGSGSVLIRTSNNQKDENFFLAIWDGKSRALKSVRPFDAKIFWALPLPNGNIGVLVDNEFFNLNVSLQEIYPPIQLTETPSYYAWRTNPYNPNLVSLVSSNTPDKPFTIFDFAKQRLWSSTKTPIYQEASIAWFDDKTFLFSNPNGSERNGLLTGVYKVQ